MTKAQKIFDQTYYATLKHVETWGYEPEADGGWSGGWITATENNPDGELIYQRTQNALIQILKRKMSDLQTYFKFNVGTPERRELLTKVYCMMAKTANNQYIAGKAKR